MSVFEPTNEWQVIKPGQSIPPGLHVRIDMQTGLKEAKLMDSIEAAATKGTSQSHAKFHTEMSQGVGLHVHVCTVVPSRLIILLF